MSLHPSEPLQASIGACKPLIGHWVGVYEDQPVEECWFPPISGQMMGCFRWVREGKVWMYEFTQFAEVEGGVVWRIKHFNEDLVGWEEKDKCTTFDLVSASETQVVFKQRKEEVQIWSVYDCSQPGKLRAWFECDYKEHHTQSIFEYSLRA